MLRWKEWEFKSATLKGGRVLRHKVTELRLYSEDREKIELEFKPVNLPENGDIQWEDWNCYDSLRIFITDYERLLIPLIDKLFPVTDPDPMGWGVQERFDATDLNWFGSEDRQKLISLIEERAQEVNADEKEFYAEVLKFLRGYTEISEYFCIEGNL